MFVVDSYVLYWRVVISYVCIIICFIVDLIHVSVVYVFIVLICVAY